MRGGSLRVPSVTASLSLYTNEGVYKRRSRNVWCGAEKVTKSSTPGGTGEEFREGRQRGEISRGGRRNREKMRGKALKLDSSGGTMIKALEKGSEDRITPSNERAWLQWHEPEQPKRKNNCRPPRTHIKQTSN